MDIVTGVVEKQFGVAPELSFEVAQETLAARKESLRNQGDK